MSSTQNDRKIVPIERDGKWGFINDVGQVIIPCKYDEVWAFSHGIVRVKLNGRWGFINKEGEEVIPCIFDDTGFLSDEGLVVVELNGKYGYYNKYGCEVAPCKYDGANDFKEGRALVLSNNLFGYIDTMGIEIIPCQFDCANSFIDEYAKVWNGDKWGVIDKSGNKVIPCIFEDLDDFAHEIHLEYNVPMFMRFIDYCEKTIDFLLPAPAGYRSAPLCALDSVFSIGVKYGSVKKVVSSFIHWLGNLSMETEITTSEVLSRIGNRTGAELSGLLNNYQRTDTHTNSILKSDAYIQFLNVMNDFSVETCADIERMIDNQEFQASVKTIRGQSSGLTLEYLFILAGVESYVKVDRHITRFVQTATGMNNLNKAKITGIVQSAAKFMSFQNHPGMNARWLDHLIWVYQSSLGNN